MCVYSFQYNSIYGMNMSIDKTATQLQKEMLVINYRENNI